MNLTQVNERIEQLRTEMVTSLSELISIPSVAQRTQGPDPFGPAVRQAYDYMLAKAGQAGFPTWDADHFGGHIDFPRVTGASSEDGDGSTGEPLKARTDGSTDGSPAPGEGGSTQNSLASDDSPIPVPSRDIVGILTHLDVVPAGEGWEFEPFGGEVRDGFVCGRGAWDDKGPVIAVFYAMKALKECGYRPARTIRLILGLDEETEWEGMRHYLAFAETLPARGFTPDADFPVTHGEKGILVFDIARKFGRPQAKGLQLRSVRGGTAANVVADQARAVVYDETGGGYDEIKGLITAFRESTGRKVYCRGTGKSLEIRAEGRPAHGSRPWQGENAISLLMEVLGMLRFASDDTAEFIRFYNDHIGYDLHGERIGCPLEDDISGKLVWNVGKIELDKGSVQLTVNVRYPVTADEARVYGGIMPVIDPFDLGIIKGKHHRPIYIPAEDPLVTTLMDVYRRQTGDEVSQPLVIGGGTYARAMEGIVAFGARFPGEPALEHQKNEKISVEDLVRLAGIYAEAIVALAGEAPAKPHKEPSAEGPVESHKAPPEEGAVHGDAPAFAGEIPKEAPKATDAD